LQDGKEALLLLNRGNRAGIGEKNESRREQDPSTVIDAKRNHALKTHDEEQRGRQLCKYNKERRFNIKEVVERGRRTGRRQTKRPVETERRPTGIASVITHMASQFATICADLFQLLAELQLVNQQVPFYTGSNQCKSSAERANTDWFFALFLNPRTPWI